MDHLKPLNQKAKVIEAQSLRQLADGQEPSGDVHAMQQLPLGCTLSFVRDGKRAKRTRNRFVPSDGGRSLRLLDNLLMACSGSRPDHQFSGLDSEGRTAGNDWRKLDLIFPEDKGK